MEINYITPEDFIMIESIGKKSLKIYYDKEDIKYLYNINNNNILKGTIDDKIIGFIFYVIQGDNNIHINSFAITEEFRNKGYGTQFINHIKKYKKSITLNTEEENYNAIKFYEKNYFIIKEIKNDYYENLKNNNAYFMKYDTIN